MSEKSLDEMTIVEMLDFALSNTKHALGLILEKIEDGEGVVADEIQVPMDHLTGAKNLDKAGRWREAGGHAQRAMKECHALSNKFRAIAFRELNEARRAASLAAGLLAEKAY